MINKISLSILFIILFSSFGFSQEYKLFEQGNYWLIKWNTNSKISANEIVIFMDTSNNPIDLEYNKKLGNQLITSLSQDNIKANLVFMGDTINRCSDNLIIEFKRLKSNKVKLSLFNVDNPVCNRFDVMQTNLFPENEKSIIKTQLSISTIDEDFSMKKATDRMAKLIKKSLK